MIKYKEYDRSPVDKSEKENLERPKKYENKELAPYKIHDLNKDVEKQLLHIKNIYGNKSNGKIELSPIKDVTEIIKKARAEVDKIKDYENRKKEKLPMIGMDMPKQDKLPPLNRGYHSPDGGNTKLKELSKVYKVNIGADEYNPLAKPAYKKEKYRDHSLKNPGADNGIG